jgi:DNA repair protein RadC
VLGRFGGFAELLHAQAADLKSIKGLGPAKQAELAAVIEMADRFGDDVYVSATQELLARNHRA